MTPPFWLTLLLGFLTAVGPVSTDMYLPAFPAITAEFHGPAQITLAAWFAGLAVGQITQGSLSDRLGRRAPLLFGTSLYALASAGCALAPDLGWFSAWRVLAAFGGSAGMVVPRAIVRDLADGHAAARMLSRLVLIMGVVPILAPALGGAVLTIAGWRVIFWAATFYGALCTVLVWAWLPDTLPETRRLKLGLGGIVARYAQVARERSFLTNALAGGLATTALFVYLAGSPTAFIVQYRVSPSHYGMLFGLNAAGYIAGSQLCARVLPRFGTNAVLRTAVRALVLASCALMIDAATGFGGVAGLVLPLFACLASTGFIMPPAVVGALSRHAAHAGSASALMGTGQFGLAALGGLAVGALSDGTARPMAALMLVSACLAGIADLYRPRS
ncbi:MAG: multidrug effflux MFS transporter [Acidisphaera sp.]|nr:multidrug effflux MFS transporter [Acidisphaera sp.]